MTIFNSIGKTYNKTRAADERIVPELIRLINPEKNNYIIADIGAGTGSYSIALADTGCQIRAIEPSATMIFNSQRSTKIEWIIGCAEALPIQTGSVDAVISLLALPHFVDIELAFGEMNRISKKGPIWRRPHLYLDPVYRANISSFHIADAAAVNEGVQRLAADLENGYWEKSYGEVLRMDRMDAGYYFLLAG